MVESLSSVSCDGQRVGGVEEVLASASEAYVCVDVEGRVVAWNPAAETTFGYTRVQACGKLIEDLVVPSGSQAAYRAVVDRLAAGARAIGTCSAVAPDAAGSRHG